MISSISRSRPMTGSMRPSAASSVRLRPSEQSEGYSFSESAKLEAGLDLERGAGSGSVIGSGRIDSMRDSILGSVLGSGVGSRRGSTAGSGSGAARAMVGAGADTGRACGQERREVGEGGGSGARLTLARRRGMWPPR